MSKNTMPQHTPKIVYLDRGSLPERIHLNSPQSPHQWVNYATTNPEQIIERCQNAEVLVVNKVKIGEAVLSACPSIRHIAVSATGFNVIDLDACQRHGVSVSNIPSYAATTVSEHVINVSLCLRRELLQYRQQVIDGAWQKSDSFCLFDKPINDLSRAVFGVIGFGEIGKATARLASALGMTVIFCSRSSHDCKFAKQVSFDELITNADIISLHCSLTAKTEKLIGQTELNKMKDSAVLVNTARGGIADEEAVVKAVKDKQIAGIAFDVLIEEPPAQNSPLLAIADRSNVIISPHIGWASEQAMQNLADILVDNIDAFLSGKPKNIVTEISNTQPIIPVRP